MSRTSPTAPLDSPRSVLDLDRVALLCLGAGLILFVLLNGLGALGAYFGPIGDALHGAGLGWFDMTSHNGLLYSLPDLLLYIGVAAFVTARLRGVWARYRGLNLFALFTSSPGPTRPGPRPLPDSEPFEPQVELESEPELAPEFGSGPEQAWPEPDSDAPPTDFEDAEPVSAKPGLQSLESEPVPAARSQRVAKPPGAWRARLAKAYAVLSARRPIGSRATKSGRAREALRVLLLPSGKESDDQTEVKPDDRAAPR